MNFGLIAFGVFLVAVIIIGLCSPSDDYDPGENASIGWHRRNGQYRVLYSDGQYSQPFSYYTARDYAQMFNGVVVPKDHNLRVRN
jgi:hypothetical protein